MPHFPRAAFGASFAHGGSSRPISGSGQYLPPLPFLRFSAVACASSTAIILRPIGVLSMSHSRSRRRSFLLPIAAVTTAAALGLAGLPPAAAAPDPAPGRPGAGHPASDRKGNFDARSVASSRRAGTLRAVRPDAERARRRLQQHLGSQAVVDLDPVTGTPAMVGRLDGFLTGASSASAQSVTRRFLTTNASTLGLSAADLETLTSPGSTTCPGPSPPGGSRSSAMG
jgi:hypothetical protein